MNYFPPRHDQDSEWLEKLAEAMNARTVPEKRSWSVTDAGHANYCIMQTAPAQDADATEATQSILISNHRNPDNDPSPWFLLVQTDDGEHGASVELTPHGMMLATAHGTPISVLSFESVANWVLNRAWPSVFTRALQDIRRAREAEERYADPEAHANWLRDKAQRTATTSPETADAAAICHLLVDINTTLMWLAAEVRATRNHPTP